MLSMRPCRVQLRSAAAGRSILVRPLATLHRATSRASATIAATLTPVTSLRPVMISIDDTQSAEDAVQWTYNSLNHKGDEFHLVHVVCDPRSIRSQTPVGVRSGTGRVILDTSDAGNSPAGQAYRERLMTAAEDVVIKRSKVLREAGAAYQIRLPYMPGARAAATIAQAVLADAADAQPRVVVVANHGPGALAEFGSVARYLYQHSPFPLLLIPDGTGTGESSTTGREVLLVMLHVKDPEAHWRWFTDSVYKTGQKVRVLLLGSQDSSDVGLPADLVSEMRATGAVFEDLSSTSSSMAQDAIGEQVCVLAQGPAVHLVVFMDDSERSLVAEALQGCTASYVSRNCSKPLLLLHNPE